MIKTMVRIKWWTPANVLVFLMMIFFHTASGQSVEPLPLLPLSKSEMYADFDTLTKTIREISPQIEVRKKITGVDIVRKLEEYRRKIDRLNTIEEFAILIRAALTLCQDGHTSLIRKDYYPADSIYLQLGISQTAINLQAKYDSLFDKIVKAKKFNLRLRYIDGNYYNLYPFYHHGLLLKQGYKLVSCNGVEINEFVQNLCSSKRMLRWDFRKSQWFSEDFFNSYDLKASDSLKLEFLDLTDKPISGRFCLKDSLQLQNDFQKSLQNVSLIKKVEYFEQEKILYIRMPEMEEGEFYSEKILQLAKDREIFKIVIDIRDNPGGSDFAWMKVLSAIISDPIRQENLILCNNSPLMKCKFPEASKRWTIYQSPVFPESNYAVYAAGQSTIKPDINSLKFSGAIYVIQNENIYSSAGSLSAIGALADNITTVGSPTGRLLGKGISPLIFELPHSKIMYRIEPVIDFMNVKRPEDVFHDTVEMPVELSIAQYVQRLQEKGDVYSKDYLLNHDPVFKTILLK
ncbi:S41 family peptidase [Dyadobacter sp. CY261]|uniref:S41 family peptidase n=1 Tax=Dyadobacter sp. CY261 TaxID=2907203 RepID=UPI001F4372E7|nr:S41 family peptidase [Dyadobacter sp. CY261]MCF0069136.1 S41 family peptidase [Dyadobacter sp. CY261]